MAKLVLALSLGLLASSCRKADRIAALTEEFVYTTLSFSPVSATAAGLHQYEKQNLDDQLDDLSPAGLDRQRRFYADFQRRLQQGDSGSLSPDDRVDLTILGDQTALALLELNQIHTPQHNPTLYVETVGNAIFSPFVLEYAPFPERVRHIIARLQKVPVFLDQASVSLMSAPAIWIEVAKGENQGNIDLIDKSVRAKVPDELKDQYARAAAPALEALHKFQDFLEKNLPSRAKADWRLGKDLYTRKFRYTLESGVEPDTALDQAERQLQAVRKRMLDIALPLHRQMFATHGDHAGSARENAIIGEVLGRIAERHSARESYMDDARKDLDEARAFVEQKHLLTLPPRSNLQVIPTPEFMRGIYAVGGFSPAPALEPQLGAFYWITPIPETWERARVESKLREYNFYKLKLLTIHEAMPGHYVQLEYANDVKPAPRRLLRSVYGNGPYIEGWGQYATQMMLDEGFQKSPEMDLTFAKEELRVVANAILDVRLQMLNMTDDEALDLMETQTFQEKEEATAKLQRAKLSSCQLPTYFVGWRGWLRVRDEYKNAKGSAYKLSEFNDSALRAGAVPLTELGRLLH